MPKKDMLEQVQKEFELLPNRKILEHKDEIFKKNKFTSGENEV